jgi:hypothetical protein
MQAVPVGDGAPDGEVLGLLLGDPDGEVLGLVLGDPLGLVLGEPDGDPLGLVLGDAFALLRAARGLVAPGAAAAPPARPAGLDAPDLAPLGDGRAPGVVALAGAVGVGEAVGASRNAPVISSATSAAPVTTAAPTAIPAVRRRRCDWPSHETAPMMPVPRVMRDGTAHSSET